MDPTQANRLAAIKTKLADDVLVLRGFRGEEHLSQPFTLYAELSSKDPAIALGDLIASPVGIRLDLGKKGTRYFHGYISKITQMPGDSDGARYEAVIVPWLWLLTRTSDCRIFQEMSVIDIIQKVFRDAGFTDYKNKTSASYTKREYCVQYRETAFNFVSRLMEEEGITYYFLHEEARHYLVLADSPSSHSAVSGYEKVEWHPANRGDQRADCLRQWFTESQLQPGKYSHRSYNFKKPRVDLDASASYPETLAGEEMEIYDYPGSFESLDAGEKSASIRVEELGSAQDLTRGSGEVMGLAAGYTFELSGHPRDDQNVEYLVTGIS